MRLHTRLRWGAARCATTTSGEGAGLDAWQRSTSHDAGGLEETPEKPLRDIESQPPTGFHGRLLPPSWEHMLLHELTNTEAVAAHALAALNAGYQLPASIYRRLIGQVLLAASREAAHRGAMRWADIVGRSPAPVLPQSSPPPGSQSCARQLTLDAMLGGDAYVGRGAAAAAARSVTACRRASVGGANTPSVAPLAVLTFLGIPPELLGLQSTTEAVADAAREAPWMHGSVVFSVLRSSLRILSREEGLLDHQCALQMYLDVAAVDVQHGLEGWVSDANLPDMYRHENGEAADGTGAANRAGTGVPEEHHRSSSAAIRWPLLEAPPVAEAAAPNSVSLPMQVADMLLAEELPRPTPHVETRASAYNVEPAVVSWAESLGTERIRDNVCCFLDALLEVITSVAEFRSPPIKPNSVAMPGALLSDALEHATVCANNRHARTALGRAMIESLVRCVSVCALASTTVSSSGRGNGELQSARMAAHRHHGHRATTVLAAGPGVCDCARWSDLVPDIRICYSEACVARLAVFTRLLSWYSYALTSTGRVPGDVAGEGHAFRIRVAEAFVGRIAVLPWRQLPSASESGLGQSFNRQRPPADASLPPASFLATFLALLEDPLLKVAICDQCLDAGFSAELVGNGAAQWNGAPLSLPKLARFTARLRPRLTSQTNVPARRAARPRRGRKRKMGSEPMDLEVAATAAAREESALLGDASSLALLFAHLCDAVLQSERLLQQLATSVDAQLLQALRDNSADLLNALSAADSATAPSPWLSILQSAQTSLCDRLDQPLSSQKVRREE
ncbi:hypothetical protein CDCA_CDCA13G3672 [Cyanidium caldarium]|uniref:Uncharacterized protein n=1 Tax=Cyanidium caldarium TaxID=2771 RepID=A0AAV9IZ80_CYACA|nr:hypothetical protein CDCA_CDCA13G3672 [Cyanidium caldarium]